MAQIIIDTATDSPALIQYLGAQLLGLADFQTQATVPTGTAKPIADPALLPNGGGGRAPTPPPPPQEPTAAQVFGAIPPPPPVETAPIATAPAGSTVIPTLAPAAASIPAPPAMVPAAPPAPTIGAPELDVNGLPWDARIHAGERQRNKDLSWRFKRGVDDTTKATVTAELRLTYPAPVVAGPVPPPPPPAIPPPPPPPSVLLPPAPGPVPPGQHVGVPAGPNEGVTFQSFVTQMANPAIAGGRMSQPQLMAAVQKVTGSPSLMTLNGRPDFIGQVIATLRAEGIQL